MPLRHELSPLAGQCSHLFPGLGDRCIMDKMSAIDAGAIQMHTTAADLKEEKFRWQLPCRQKLLCQLRYVNKGLVN